jgi:hypothetical protein
VGLSVDLVDVPAEHAGEHGVLGSTAGVLESLCGLRGAVEVREEGTGRRAPRTRRWHWLLSEKGPKFCRGWSRLSVR